MSLLEQDFGGNFDDGLQSYLAGEVRVRTIIAPSSGRKSIMSILATGTKSDNTVAGGGSFLQLYVFRRRGSSSAQGSNTWNLLILTKPADFGFDVIFAGKIFMPNTNPLTFGPGELVVEDGGCVHVVLGPFVDGTAGAPIEPSKTKLTVTGIDETPVVNVKFR
jgi:hypothetical protein